MTVTDGRFTSHALGLSVVSLAFVSCLPADTRPVPASLDVTVTADPLLLGGSTGAPTVDGWTVSYDRFLLSMGGASLDGDTSCGMYYNDGYRRILDMTVAAPQKLNLLYALGHCDFGFRVQGPEATSVLGERVTEADRAFMGAPGTDPYAANHGISLYVKGRATRNGVTKSFTWAFRVRVSFEKCRANGDAGPEGFNLTGHEAAVVDLRVRGDTLFLDSLEPTQQALRFDPIAAADDKYGNGDGDVSLAELGLVPLPDIDTDHRYAEPAALDGGISTWRSLEDYVYLGLFPEVVRFERDGSCAVTVGDHRR